MHYTRWQIALILTVCAIGFLFSLPNLFSPAQLADWPLQRQIHLGLDLKGGTYLLEEVDLKSVERERLESSLDTVRTKLRTLDVGYTNLEVRDDAIRLQLRDPARAADIGKQLRDALSEDPSVADYALTTGADGAIALSLTEASLRERGSQIIAQAIEIVRRRIDQTGVVEPQIARQGSDRILIQLPGIQDPQRVKDLLGKTAKMTFRLLSPEAVPANGRALPGTDLLPAENETGLDGKPRQYMVRKRIEVDGGDLTDARAGLNQQTGEWVVNFAFNSQGARRFGQVTEQNVGKPFAIVLDNKVISAPVIREPITGGRGQISGHFTAASANDLAILLRAGALPAPLKVIEERTVGPDLGADAIRAGIYACVIGMLLVMGFMVAAYGLFGIFAAFALIINLALIIGLLSLLQATLTLPGIVGILLTIGMSVDANVLINERIREETRKGRTPLGAMQVGFSRAFGTILDANLTTLIKMVILYIIGTGPIKGFAVTISIGIMTSMFTAIVFVRMLMATWLRRTRVKVLAMWRFRLVRDDTRIQFMKGRIAGLVVSAVLSTASIALYFYPGLNLGIDFTGGIVMEIRTPEAADFGKLRSSLTSAGLNDVGLQEFGSPQDVMIRLAKQEGGDAAQQAAVAKVRTTLDKDFPGTQVRRVDAVGGTVSDELFFDGMLGLSAALVAMLIYIWFRFEWQFGVGAVVTLVLDMTKMVGLYVVLGALFQVQFNLTSVVAILTIMGYSINDKVVVYDRVRENLRLYKGMPLRELIDLSINETLNRTIATSMTVFLATLPLALIAGEALRDFAIVLLLGIVIGTSSSIFIAAPILLFLGQRALRPGAPARAAAEPAE